MQEFDGKDIKKVVSVLFRKLADRIEKDEDLAKFLFGEISKAVINIEDKNRTERIDEENTFVDLATLFSIYSKEGKDSLVKILEVQDIEELKKLIGVNGLDPSQKARKWKTKDRVINLIVEVIEQKMSHGSAFME